MERWVGPSESHRMAPAYEVGKARGARRSTKPRRGSAKAQEGETAHGRGTSRRILAPMRPHPETALPTAIAGLLAAALCGSSVSARDPIAGAGTLLPRADGPVALVGGTVHTMVPGEAPFVATVLVGSDGRIRDVAPDLPVPPGAVRIDCRGKHVVPGLIDALVGFDPAHDALYTAAGVTLVRDIGNDPSRIFALRRRELRDYVPGPTLLTAGVLIDGAPPSTPTALMLHGAEQAQRDLGILIDQRPDFLSVHAGVPAELWPIVIELGHERGLQVWGPRTRDMTLADTIAGGLDGLLYVDGFLPPEVDWDIVLPLAFDRPVAAAAEAGMRVVPMLGGMEKRLQFPTTPDQDLAYLGPHFVPWWSRDLAARNQQKASDPRFMEVGERVMSKQAALVKKLHDAGVHLVPGSGAPNPWIFPGRGLHEELALWRAAGIADAELLRLATWDAARALRVANEHGSIQVSYLANLVVADGDPTADIGVLREPHAVVVRGIALTREDLDDVLETLQIEQSAAREEASKPLEIDPPVVPDGAVVLEGQVETVVNTERVSGERFAVVREVDGGVAICSRMVTPPQGVWAGREVEITQHLMDGELQKFTVSIRSADEVLQAFGLFAEGQWRVRRKHNGEVLATEIYQQRVRAISLDSVTTALALGQAEHAPGGEVEALFVFRIQDALEPELVRWETVWDATTQHLVATSLGRMLFDFHADGSPRVLRKQVGGNVVDTILVWSETHGGAGFPLPPAKRARIAERDRMLEEAENARRGESGSDDADGGEGADGGEDAVGGEDADGGDDAGGDPEDDGR